MTISRALELRCPAQRVAITGCTWPLNPHHRTNFRCTPLRQWLSYPLGGRLHASKCGPCAPTPNLWALTEGSPLNLGPDLWALTGGTRLIPPNFLGVVRRLFRGRTDHILRHAARPQGDTSES